MPKNRVCDKHDCGKKHYAKGYCLNHYQQWYRKGHTNPVSPALPSKAPTTLVTSSDMGPEQPGILYPHDRKWMRLMWVRAQGHRCGVCNAAAWQYPEEGGVYGFWRLSVDRSCCEPARLCCIRGTVCSACHRPLEVLSHDRTLPPSKSIHGMSISEWTEAALNFLQFDSDRSGNGFNQATPRQETSSQ
jgi:hypothetical protein